MVGAVGGIDDGLVGEFLAIFADRALDLLCRAGLVLNHALELPRRQILPSGRGVSLAVVLIPPESDVDHIYRPGALRVRENRILHILRTRQANDRMLAGLFLP